MVKKKYVKFTLLKTFDFESRDLREISVASEIFDEIVLFATAYEYKEDYYNNYKIIFLPIRYSSFKVFRYFQILKTLLFTIPRILSKQNAHIISCHDLYSLFIGWLSNFYNNSNKAFLVYDSHEFEAFRNAERNLFSRLFVYYLEKFLIHKADFTIIVNNSIANEIKKIHNLKNLPLVIRNIPNKYSLDFDRINKKRSEIQNLFTSEYKDAFMLIYHGGIFKGRGIELLVQSISLTENTVAVIMGFGEDKYIEEIKNLAKIHKVLHRIQFIKAVKNELLWEYVGCADAGFCVIEPIVKSYYLSLPNKFFECIQSLTPIICSDFPEMSFLLNKYNIGVSVNPTEIKEIVSAINNLKNNTQTYLNYKENLRIAKDILCWENERELLRKKYIEYAFDK